MMVLWTSTCKRSSLTAWMNSAAGAVSRKLKNSNDDEDEMSTTARGHIMVVIPPWVVPVEETVLHPMISLATSLKEGFNVSIVEMRLVSAPTDGEELLYYCDDGQIVNALDEGPKQSYLEGGICPTTSVGIQQKAPGDGAALEFRQLLDLSAIKPNPFLQHFVVEINSNDTTTASRAEYSSLCPTTTEHVHPFSAIDRAELVAKAFDEGFDRVPHPINMIVLDSTNVGVALRAEQHQIPYTMIAHPDEHELIRLEESLFTTSWRDRFFQRRWQSLSWGYSLRQLNRLRKRWNLPVLRKPTDYYQAATTILLHPDYQRGRLPVTPHTTRFDVHNVRPLIPECVACDPNLESSQDVTVLVEPIRVTMMEMRAIIRGIALARASLEAQADLICDAQQQQQRYHQEKNCKDYKYYSKVKAVLLTHPNETQHLPRLLPSFVDVETSHPIDSLARHRFTFAVVSHCDAGSHVATAIGVSVVCLAQRGQTLQSAARSAHTLGTFVHPRGSDIATALISILDGRARNNRSVRDMTHAPKTITQTTSQMMIANMTGVSIEQIRSQQLKKHRKKFSLNNQVHPNSNYNGNGTYSSNDWIFRTVLMGASFVVVVSVVYTHAFLEHVKLPTQMPGWRRRFRMLTQYTHDIDPCLIQLQKWLANPNSIHNRLVPPLKDEEETDEGIKRSQSHQHNRHNQQHTHHEVLAEMNSKNSANHVLAPIQQQQQQRNGVPQRNGVRRRKQVRKR